MPALLLLSFLLAIVGCSNDDFAKTSDLDRLRVLALVVDTPEIQNPSAGTVNVQLNPYVSDVAGSGDVQVVVQSCLDPGVNFGAQPTCEGASYASAKQTITATASSGTASDVFGSPERTGRLPSGAITVPLTIPTGLLSAYSSAVQNNGVSYLLDVTVTRGSDSVKAFRRVLISTKTANTNPTLTDIYSQGSTLTVLPSGEVALTFGTTTSEESYSYLSTSGETLALTEEFDTSWYISDGELSQFWTKKGESSTWTPPSSAPSGRKVVVAAVMRDGRGGVSVLIRRL